MADDEYRFPDEVVRDLRAGLTRATPHRRSGRAGRSEASGRSNDRSRSGGRRRRSGPQPGLLRGVGLAVLLVVIALVGAGMVRGAVSSPAADPGEPAAGEPAGSSEAGTDDSGGSAAAGGSPDWSRVVGDLDAARHTALRELDDAALDQVYVATAPALDDDLAAIARLRSSGLVLDGLAVEVGSVEQLDRPSMDRVVLRVTDRRDAYRVVAGGSGEEVESVPARGERTWRLVLDRTGADWRIARVEEVG